MVFLRVLAGSPPPLIDRHGRGRYNSMHLVATLILVIWPYHRIANESLAGTFLSARRHLGRDRREFRALLGTCEQSRAVPIRCRRCTQRDGAHRLTRADGPGLAWLFAGREAGATLRIPGARPL